ncbi:MAG: ABC transporter substrate-binding protein [Chloroflexi bacterium]|nr:ABC transporter substrate-binding protein [Chloroflexota bacterium]
MSKRSRTASMALWLMVGLLLACAPASPPAPAPTPKPAPAPTKAPAAAPTVKPAGPAPTPKPAAQPTYGGHLTIGSESDPPSLDPHQEAAGAVINIIAPVYNGVVQAGPLDTTKVIADLAEGWEVSADGTAYTFRLHKGVKFHDGAPFTSQDAKYSLERIKNPPAGTRSLRRDFLQVVSKIEAPDGNTLRIILSYPSASFLPMLASPWMMILPKHVVEKEGDMKRAAVGTGPFKFRALTRGVSGRVMKNADYFIKGRPYLDEITVYVVPDSFTRFAALRAGNILLIRGTPGISVAQAKTIEATMPEKIVLQRGPQGLSQGIGLHSRKAPFTDVRVRQAISYALDRDKAVKVIVDGAGIVGGVFPPFWGWGHSEQELAMMPGYGPDKEANVAMAKKLLADAGFPNGFKTSITTRKHPGHEPAAVFANAELGKIGVHSEVQLFETATHTDLRVRGDFEVLSLGIAAALPDPDETLSQYWLPNAGLNATRYENPKFTELYEKQTRTLDVAERKKLVNEMEKVALTDSVNIVYFWYVRIVPHWVQVKGFVKAPHHFYATKMEHVWLAK